MSNNQELEKVKKGFDAVLAILVLLVIPIAFAVFVFIKGVLVEGNLFGLLICGLSLVLPISFVLDYIDYKREVK